MPRSNFVGSDHKAFDCICQSTSARQRGQARQGGAVRDYSITSTLVMVWAAEKSFQVQIRLLLASNSTACGPVPILPSPSQLAMRMLPLGTTLKPENFLSCAAG